METLPSSIQEKIFIQYILLHKKEKGWSTIHQDILSEKLYLKYTPYIFNSKVLFEKIERIKKSIYFLNKKKYTWLLRMVHNPFIYYYKPIQCVYSVNDLFSEEYYSNFINLHNINHII